MSRWQVNYRSLLFQLLAPILFSIKVGMTKQDESSPEFGVFQKRILTGHCHPDFSINSQGELYADVCLLRVETIQDHEFKSITGRLVLFQV